MLTLANFFLPSACSTCKLRMPSSVMKSTARQRPLFCWLLMQCRPSMVTSVLTFTSPCPPTTGYCRSGWWTSTSWLVRSGRNASSPGTTNTRECSGRDNTPYSSLYESVDRLQVKIWEGWRNSIPSIPYIIVGRKILFLMISHTPEGTTENIIYQTVDCSMYILFDFVVVIVL